MVGLLGRLYDIKDPRKMYAEWVFHSISESGPFLGVSKIAEGFNKRFRNYARGRSEFRGTRSEDITKCMIDGIVILERKKIISYIDGLYLILD